MHEAARIMLYALVAAASPTAFLATLAVLSSRRKRLNSIVFMAGFMLSQTAVLVVVYLLGATANDTARHSAAAYIELVVGTVVLVICATRPGLLRPRTRQGSPRTTAVLERLRRVTPGVSLGIGAFLGVGAKRLVITMIAAGTLALSALSGVATLWLGLTYVIVATVIVWFPVVYSVILGRHAEALVGKARTHTETLGRHASLVGMVVGGLLVADSLVRLRG